MNIEKKQELINKIANNLIGKFEWDQENDFTLGEEPFLESLKWLPEENLEKLCNCDVSGCKDFNEAYQLYGKAGALRFSPYIVDEKSSPSLCIRRNRFLHMFRGYYFQVSGTVDGIYSCGTGIYSTNFLVNPSRDYKVFRKGFISYMLWWAAFIDAGFKYDNVRKLYEDDKSVLDKFMQKSMEYWNAGREQHWSDIEPYISFSDGHIKPCRKIYSLLNNNGEIAAYFAIGKKTIQVETSAGLLTVVIPDLCAGTGYNLEDEDDRWDFEEQLEILENNHYLEMLTVMALNLQGIKITFHNWFPLIRTLGTIKPLFGKEVTLVKSANEFYNCKPDEC